MSYFYRFLKKNLFIITLFISHIAFGNGPAFNSFTFVSDSTGQDTLAPAISFFTPTSGHRRDSILIRGIHFTGTSAVAFGGTAAASFFTLNDSTVVAIVGSGATGNVSVTTSFGTATKSGFTFIRDSTSHDSLTPVITTFSPASARKGTRVTIFGFHFTGATAVSFGGVAADSIRVLADTAIFANVGSGASGNVSVTNPFGTATKSGFTFISDTTGHDSTVISFFTPTSGHRGDTIRIVGKHFTRTSAVAFGGTAAPSFFNFNDSTILAIVGSGSTGKVSVTTPLGFATKPGFTFISDSTGHDTTAPIITRFTPTSGHRGDTIRIVGKHFTGTSAVAFGGTAASSFFTFNDSTIITIVGPGSSGFVAVTTPLGTVIKPGFTFISDSTGHDTTKPVITRFTPTSGYTGTTIWIYGKHFAGTTAVSFGGVRVDSFLIVSDTSIRTIVGTGASGNVSVTTPFGTATLGGFIYRTSPVLTSFTPTSAARGTKVTLKGAHLSGVKIVKFGGVSADSFLIVSDSVILATVGSGATGYIQVQSPDGISSIQGFTYINTDSTSPSVYRFIPSRAPKGAAVNIYGNHFTGTTSVSFGGVPASSYSYISDTAITAIVGPGASGNITVTTPFGTATKPGFIFISDSTIHDTMPPVISFFTPTSGHRGDSIFIVGTHLKGATAVAFGGTPADWFSAFNDSTIIAMVDSGSTGNVTVTTPYGTATKPGFIFISDSTGNDSTLLTRRLISGEITSLPNERFTIYPNPATRFVMVKHPAINHYSQIQLVDIGGRLVKTMVVGNNATQTTVNLQGLTHGVYKLILSDGEKTFTGTLLVK